MIPLALLGLALTALGLCRDRPVFLLWGTGLALVIAAYALHEQKVHKARQRARRRGGFIV